MNRTLPYCDILARLLGGCAEPIGETNRDNEKLEIQNQEETIILWLMDDMYRCFEKKDVYWGSGQIAGRKAEKFLTELYETIGDYLGAEREEE